jgi:hypothetical protein
MNIINKLPNKYYVLHQGQQPVPWNPPDPEPLDWVDYTYFGKVFEAMEKNLEVGGLVFYFTWSNVDELPSYGPNVVAVVAGDEWCRTPKYVDKVKAIFKCLATRPLLGCNPFLKPSYLNFLTLVQFGRIWLIRLPYLSKYLFSMVKALQPNAAKIAPIFAIPQGYGGGYLELPIKEIDKRQYDIFFAGSIEHGNYPILSLRHWLDNPKSLSRKAMISSIKIVKIKYPALRAELAVTSSFGANFYSDQEDYCKVMMDTKVCLVPRGTSWETLRFYEGLKYGCILITETLPAHWFYENAPIIQIADWSELEIVLPRLLENKALMLEKHQESLNWWKTKCSEAIVGDYMAEKLNSLANLSQLQS